MSLASNVLRFVTRKSAQRFESASKDPVGVQREKLLRFLAKNADTEYGRKYGFASIKSVEDYQKQVPLVSYEDIREDMDRVAAGAKNVFTAEDPALFAQTSGTSGTPKYVPVTPTCQGREHSDVMRTWMAHAIKAHPEIFKRKVVSLVSPAIEGYTPSGLPFGSTSGHMYKNMPRLVRGAYSIPYRAFEIADYEAKYYVIMRTALGDDVRFLATANPSSILKMAQKGNEFGEDIIKDVRDGTLSKDYTIEPDIRAEIERLYRPRPERARELERLRSKRDGVLKPGDYWPDLALIGCWKGGTVGHYIEKFKDWFDTEGRRSTPVRDWGYLSSEARGSIPLSDVGSEGALTIATNFFEFVDPDEVAANPDDPTKWNFLTVGDVQDGAEYYIFFTTTGGLYRYDINDVVQVQGYYNQTPQIVFLRKGRGQTNLTGEKMSVNQVIDAFQKAAQDTGVVAAHFKAEADAAANRYIFRAEFAAKVPNETHRAFLVALDCHIKELNIEYKAKRDSQRLGDPVLHVMREGWYERGRQQHASEGKRAFQAKTELLSAKALRTASIQTEVDDVIEMQA